MPLPPVIPKVEVATHLVLVPVVCSTMPFVPAELVVSRKARVRVRSATVVVARVVVPEILAVPATVKSDAGVVVPIPTLPPTGFKARSYQVADALCLDCKYEYKLLSEPTTKPELPVVLPKNAVPPMVVPAETAACGPSI